MHHVDAQVGRHGVGHVALVAGGHGHLGDPGIVQAGDHLAGIRAYGVGQHDEPGRPVVDTHHHHAAAVPVVGAAEVEQRRRVDAA